MLSLNNDLRQWILAAAVILVPFLMTLVFRRTTVLLGRKGGYLYGFVIYWIVVCAGLSFLLLNGSEMKSLYRLPALVSGHRPLANVVLLLVPLVFGYSYMFPKVAPSSTSLLVVLSLALALINASSEELLWHGLFLKAFANQPLLYYLLSSIGFAIWHYAPQTVFPNTQPGGANSLVVFSLFYGLANAFIARDQQTLVWVTASHILFDFSGLGGRIYLKAGRL